MLSNFRIGVDSPPQPMGTVIRLDFYQNGVATLPRTPDGLFFALPPGALSGQLQVRRQMFPAPAMPVTMLLLQDSFLNTTDARVLLFRSWGPSELSSRDPLVLGGFLGNQSVAFQIDGREVARRFVSEPGAAGLWALAAVALAAGGIARCRLASGPR